MSAPAIRSRIEGLDWRGIESDLFEQGHARTPRVLTPGECAELIRLYPETSHFRKRIDMERHRFGVGDYGYFSRPLPGLVRSLRTHAYRRLAPIANRAQQALARSPRFPASLAAFERDCAAKGQAKPTPLILHYEAGGYNCLHRDLYGEIFFPLQVAVLLSRPGVDFAGGELLLVQQRPRSQSVGAAISPEQGELVIFPNSEWLTPGRRGWLRSVVRHGVSRIRSGSRYTLGIIFHDAE